LDGASAQLLEDICMNSSVLVAPKGTTAASCLLVMPFWNLLAVGPAGAIMTWLGFKLLARRSQQVRSERRMFIGGDMKKRVAAVGLLAVAFALATTTARADEVYLKNGNQLSGRLGSLVDGKLELETDFAGKLMIDWGQVARLSTEQPLTVVLTDGSRLSGTLRPSTAAEQMELSTSALTDPAHITHSDVKALNPPVEPAVKLSGRVNVGLNKISGNTETESGHADAELAARTEKHRLTVGGAYNREEDDNRKTEDNVTGYLKHDYFLTQKLYWYMNAMLEHDQFKDLNLRTTVGTGLGYQVFEGEDMNLSLEAGPSYIRTDYDREDDQDSAAGRWGVKFDRFFFEKLFQSYFSNEGFVSASDTSNILMYTKTGLRFPLRSGFTVNAGFEWDWNNQPAEGTDKSDYRYILSLGYGF
jgi:putative salt-induced outer membrane protein YdiY